MRTIGIGVYGNTPGDTCLALAAFYNPRPASGWNSGSAENWRRPGTWAPISDDGDYGRVIRPGALFVPLWLWQLLQSPDDAVDTITRSLPVESTTLARYGPGSVVDE